MRAVTVLPVKEWNPGIVCPMCFQPFQAIYLQAALLLPSLPLRLSPQREVTIGAKEVNAQITQKFHRANERRGVEF